MTRLLSLAHSMLILGALCDQKTFATFTGWVFLAGRDGHVHTGVFSAVKGGGIPRIYPHIIVKYFDFVIVE